MSNFVCLLYIREPKFVSESSLVWNQELTLRSWKRDSMSTISSSVTTGRHSLRVQTTSKQRNPNCFPLFWTVWLYKQFQGIIKSLQSLSFRTHIEDFQNTGLKCLLKYTDRWLIQRENWNDDFQVSTQTRVTFVKKNVLNLVKPHDKSETKRNGLEYVTENN